MLIKLDDGYYLNSKETAIYLISNSGEDTNKEVSFGILEMKEYQKKLEILNEKFKQYKMLNDNVNKIENEIAEKGKEYTKVYENVLNRRRREGQVEALRKELVKKEENLKQKNEILASIKENLKKKREDKEFFSKVFTAFEEDLQKNKQSLAQNHEKLEMYNRIYVARKLKVLFLLGYVFFNDKYSPIYKKLLRLNDLHETNEKDDTKIANALGSVVLLGIMLSKYLNLSLAYPMIYNGPKSMIKFAKGEDIGLFLPSKSDRAKFVKGVELLVQNFSQIIAFCGITFKSRYENELAIQLPEILNCLSNYLSHFFIQ